MLSRKLDPISSTFTLLMTRSEDLRTILQLSSSKKAKDVYYLSAFSRYLVKANYFLQNGVLLDTNDVNEIAAKKRELRNTDKRVLKTVAYQAVSDYLAFINYSSKIYLIKASSLGEIIFIGNTVFM